MKNTDFAWLWAGQVVSQVGENLARVALLWFVYQLTGSALKMTVVGVLQTIPPLLLGPIAGVYLDHVPKRAAMIVIDLARSGLLVLIPLLHVSGLLSLTGLYVLVFVIALFSMAFGPALNATIPLITRKEQLTTANAIMQSSATIGQLLGPALGGILIAGIGAHNVLYANAAMFVVSVITKIPLRVQSTGAEGRAVSPQVVVRDLRQGFRFVFIQHRLLMVLMIVASLSFLGSASFVYLMPVIGERILSVTSVELGWLWSALGVGILLTTVWLAAQEQVRLCRRMAMIAAASLVGGIAMLGLTIRPSLVVATALIIIVGGSSGLVTPIVSASLQEMTPKELMARVFGVFNTGTMASAMIGMTVFGWAADRFNPSVSVLAIGGITVGTAVITVLLIPLCLRLTKATSAPA